MSKQWQSHSRFLVVSLAVSLMLAGSVAAKGKSEPPPKPKYVMTVLPLVNDTDRWTALGLNDQGDVVGLAGSHQHAVVCMSSGKAVYLEDYVTLPDDVDRIAFANSISNTGWVTGSVSVFDSDDMLYRLQAFRCKVDPAPDGTVTVTQFRVLGAPDGLTWSYGEAINDSGDVAVSAESDHVSVMAGYLWTEDGLWTQIPGTTQARDITNECEITSWIFVDGQTHAARYSPDTGTTEDLGLLPRGIWSRGYAINSSGQVAGQAIGGNGQRAFRYTDGVGMVDLGILPIEGRKVSSYSVGGDINAQGDVIGYSGNGMSGISHAFLFTDVNGMLDLTELITNAPGDFDAGTLDAGEINDSGDVCGSVRIDGLKEVVLLVRVE